MFDNEYYNKNIKLKEFDKLSFACLNKNEKIDYLKYKKISDFRLNNVEFQFHNKDECLSKEFFNDKDLYNQIIE
jgi:hypothetical protein